MLFVSFLFLSLTKGGGPVLGTSVHHTEHRDGGVGMCAAGLGALFTLSVALVSVCVGGQTLPDVWVFLVPE